MTLKEMRLAVTILKSEYNCVNALASDINAAKRMKKKLKKEIERFQELIYNEEYISERENEVAKANGKNHFEKWRKEVL